MSCPNCISGFNLPGEPTGSQLPDFLNAYFAPAPATETPADGPKRAVLLLTDVFGLALNNPKIMADYMAKELGCDVWIPDYFDGRPIMDASKMEGKFPDRAGIKLTAWDWFKFFIAVLPNIGAFIANRQSVVDQRLANFLAVLKEKKGYEKLGAVGYCFGGSVSIRAGSKGLFNSIVVAHPGRISLDDVKKINAPTAWVCAEDDFTFSDDLRHQCEAVYAERKGKPEFLDYEFVVYKGTAHGFACRPNLGVPDVKEGYTKALEQTIAWFKKTLV